LAFRDYDGKVTPEEVGAAAVFLKDSLDKQSVHELIANLAKDSGLVSMHPHFERLLLQYKFANV